ncbi:GNAT family N-acetyltransferase [Cytobacillus firmus]|uniref:GNAT family acetyltransferase n=1 Tax=Cytobacillus firmus DS1 TaxID=1307436 RepID=W7L6H2_CYTFI|nr:GNAT family N-acetyltransferase [Cytobacillus firmus]EWG11016.1 GNAT family acetyltransferase [Cytobacillus firmus DS1]
MDELIKELKAEGVHSIKGDSEIILEIFQEEQISPNKADYLINRLLTLDESRIEKVKLQCSQGILDKLMLTRGKMKVIGERVIFKKSFAEYENEKVHPYEVWPLLNKSSIAFLSEVMNFSNEQTANFLKSIEAELPEQADKMFTVYTVNSEPAGAVFPHLEPDRDREGRMFWIGIHPDFKGKGYGKNLHLIGLHRLQYDFKAEKYLGATRADNAAMRKIMEANGCTQDSNSVISLVYTFSG